MRPQHHAVRIAVLLILSCLAVKLWIYVRPATKSAMNIFKEFHEEVTPCKMHTCFNYSLCSWKSGFRVHFNELALVHPDDFNTLKYYFKVLKRYPIDPEVASLPCLYVVTVYEGKDFKNPFLISDSFNHTFRIKESILKKLPYWGKDGRNHLIINLSMKILGMDKSLGKAMVAQPTFTETGFRPGFDIIIPTIWPPKTHEGSFCPPVKPAKRTFLLSFQGTGGDKHTNNLLDIIQSTYNESIGNGILIELECYVTKKNQASVSIMDWAVCGTSQARVFLLEKSTFALILAPVHPYLNTGIFHLRLYEALKSGAIPVILGGDRVRLPFDEVLDWRRAALLIPEARVEELITLLTAIGDDDILEFRHQGRKLWEIYFSSLQGSTHSVLALIRSRLMFPPPPAQTATARPAFGKSYTPPSFAVSFPVINQYTSEPKSASVLGPINYTRNFTTSLIQGYKLWNDWGEPFVMYPRLPWDPVPTNKEIVRELGSTNLKSKLISDKFTIVISSYKRQTCLQKVLLSLRGLPFLDKVVVVWNDPMKPDGIRWPMLDVPVQVIRPLDNYRQNRFQPYALIQTDAVYIQDDNLMIKKSDIISAFRVWREHRDRLVGFFPRYQENSKYYTETRNLTSLISTSAAFVHRYYLWAYWRFLPAAVTDHIDVVERCDDIAMNFLIAHLTKKSPIQVPFDERNVKLKCSNHTLKPLKHYVVRDYCLKYFSKVMGYTPLINTELIVDLKTSVTSRTSTTVANSTTGANSTHVASSTATVANSTTVKNATLITDQNATLITDANVTSITEANVTSITADNAPSIIEANATSTAVEKAMLILNANATSTGVENATSIINANATIITDRNATSITADNATSIINANATLIIDSNATSTAVDNATSIINANATSIIEANATSTAVENANSTNRNYRFRLVSKYLDSIGDSTDDSIDDSKGI